MPRPTFPEELRTTAPRFWFQIAAGALHFAEVHADRDDRVACLANLTQAMLCTAHGRIASRGEWALNEKRLVERAGLDSVSPTLQEDRLDVMVDSVASLLDVQAWAVSRRDG